MSDSSENVQATNIFKWQSTQHGKQRLSLRHCVTDLPGQREDVSCVVAMGVTCRPKGEVFLLFPALVSDIVGW